MKNWKWCNLDIIFWVWYPCVSGYQKAPKLEEIKINNMEDVERRPLVCVVSIIGKNIKPMSTTMLWQSQSSQCQLLCQSRAWLLFCSHSLNAAGQNNLSIRFWSHCHCRCLKLNLACKMIILLGPLHQNHSSIMAYLKIVTKIWSQLWYDVFVRSPAIFNYNLYNWNLKM